MNKFLKLLIVTVSYLNEKTPSIFNYNNPIFDNGNEIKCPGFCH